MPILRLLPISGLVPQILDFMPTLGLLPILGLVPQLLDLMPTLGLDAYSKT